MRIPAPDFSLLHTLESGQLFRFETVAEGFLICHRDKAFVVSQEGDALIVHASTPNVTKEWLSHFFALDEKPPKAVDAYSRDALLYCSGMRVCRQDPWECTVGFICSQNNNIKRIRQLMTGLAKAYGKKIKVGAYSAYLFPDPGKMRDDEKLDAIRSGYRKKYLLAANNLTDEGLASVRAMSIKQAKEELLTIPGVGPKVAACILLFAYGHKQAFPIDTWVRQIMTEEYGCTSEKEIEEKAAKLFGKNAGLMQQYLFHYKRQQK
jgi:N-glycosylase/DNA lyase